MVEAAVVSANLARIRALVGPDVEILAATKYVEPAELPVLHAAGIALVGENRTDALAAKQAEFGDLFTWDFLGHVQSRQVRDLAARTRQQFCIVPLAELGSAFRPPCRTSPNLCACSKIRARAGVADRFARGCTRYAYSPASPCEEIDRLCSRHF